MTDIDPVADKKALIVKVGLLEVVNHPYHIISVVLPSFMAQSVSKNAWHD